MEREDLTSDLTGKVLIAMPGIGDDRFQNAVILICAHAEDFAMGIILNKPMPEFKLTHLLDQLKIPVNITLPDISVLDGGPVGRDRGFVLHSHDFNCDEATMYVSDNICLTATQDVLHAIASERAPEHAVLALGYAGWGAGQIEAELAENAWLVCDVDHHLVYEHSHKNKWTYALGQLGISPAFLQQEAGHS